jgi:hypothetical protein
MKPKGRKPRKRANGVAKNPGGKTMSRSRTKTKRIPKDLKGFPISVALNSRNEIYYQMASVFSAATQGKKKLSKKLMAEIIAGNPSEFFLENSL